MQPAVTVTRGATSPPTSILLPVQTPVLAQRAAGALIIKGVEDQSVIIALRDALVTAAGRLAAIEAVASTFPDEVPLEFGQHPKDVKD
jgi:hypothetical protein